MPLFGEMVGSYDPFSDRDKVFSCWHILVTTRTRSFIKIKVFGRKKVFFRTFPMILNITRHLYQPSGNGGTRSPSLLLQ